jgi:hypothetical protein
MSFVTSATGQYIALHLDLQGTKMLIETLQAIQSGLEDNSSPHFHLFDFEGHELTNSKIDGEEFEVNLVRQVDIFGWNEESARRNGLKPAPCDP